MARATTRVAPEVQAAAAIEGAVPDSRRVAVEQSVQQVLHGSSKPHRGYGSTTKP